MNKLDLWLMGRNAKRRRIRQSITPARPESAGGIAYSPAPILLDDDMPINFLINGGFDIWQRGTSVNPGNPGYGPDRWYALYSAVSAPTWSKQSGQGDFPNCGRVASNDAASRRYAVAQVIESVNSVPLRGKTVRFQLHARANAAIPIRLAVLEWTGTADGVTKSVVSNWADTDFTPGHFFSGTTLTLTGQRPGAAGVSYIPNYVEGAVSGACNNLIVIAWTENVIPQSAWFEISRAGLFAAQGEQAWIPRPMAQELAICQRYFYSIGGDSTWQVMANGFGLSATQVDFCINFPVAMRITPALSYSGSGDCATWNVVGSIPISALVMVWPSRVTMQARATIASGGSVGSPYFLVANNNINARVTFDTEL